MSVHVVKRHRPVLAVSVRAWKWFALHEDGNLGPLMYYFSQGVIVGPSVKYGEPMESEFGYWCFTEEETAKRYEDRRFHMICVPVFAIDAMADGLVESGKGKLNCRQFQKILIDLNEAESCREHVALRTVRCA